MKRFFTPVLCVLAMTIVPWSLACEGSGLEDAEVKADPMAVIPGQQVGEIKPDSSEASLLAAYGAENVEPGGFSVGEGYCEPGTVLFADDPTKTLEVMWGDVQNKQFPVRVQWFDTASAWHTEQGINIGTTAEKLVALNEGPFDFTGLGWDYGGYVASWLEGNLTKPLPIEAVRIRLAGVADMPEKGQQLDIYGEDSFNTGVLTKTGVLEHFVISQMSVVFPQNLQKYPSTGEHQKSCEQFK
ncbi:MAG: hypothetical protein KTR14_05240 [Vampirovibrio sp.]|nr:hypothetical protein [Vampirovibrio sp.]